MDNYNTIKSYRIPLRGCQEWIIDHSLVIVQLSLEWPPNKGDNPNLIINIKNKTSIMPGVQSTSPPVEPNNLHQQHPLNYLSARYHQLNMNNRNHINMNRRQSATITTAVNQNHSVSGEETSSSIAIEKIKADLLAYVLPQVAPITTSPNRDVMQTSPNSIEEARNDTNAQLVNAIHAPKPMPTVIGTYFEHQPSPNQTHSTAPNSSQNNFLLCTCPEPTNYHLSTCVTQSLNRSDMHSNFHPQTQQKQSMSVLNSSPIKPFDSSTAVTISSPPAMYSNNSAIQMLPLNSSTPYLQPTPNAPQFTTNNQSCFQSNPSMITIGNEQIEKKQKNTPARRRKSSVKNEQPQPQISNHLPDQQQTSSRKSSISQSPSPIVLQTGTASLHNDSEKIDIPTNDCKPTQTPIQSPVTTSNIRSPVELDEPISQTIDEIKLANDAIEQVIDEVAQGQGNIDPRQKPTRKSLQSHRESIRTKQSIVNSPGHPKSSASIHDLENTTKRMRSSSIETSAANHFQNSSMIIQQTCQQWPHLDVFNLNDSTLDYVDQIPSQLQVIQPEYGHEIMLEDIWSSTMNRSFNNSTPPPTQLLSMHSSSESALTDETSTETSFNNLYNAYVPSNKSNAPNSYESNLSLPSNSALETNDISSSRTISAQCFSQTEIYTETHRHAQTFKKAMSSANIQSTKTVKKSNKIFKAKARVNGSKTQSKCTRCGGASLIDITSHEFPKKQGMIFECAGCGNNSIRSNVSPEERRQRLANVAADHLNTIKCQFCQRIFHSHHEYIGHLKDDHQSDK